jgi:hypothetical protein
MEERSSVVGSISSIGGVGSESLLDRLGTRFNAQLDEVKSTSDSFYNSLSQIGGMGSRSAASPGAPTETAIAAIQEGSIMSAKLALQQVRFSIMHGGVVAATGTLKQLLKSN